MVVAHKDHNAPAFDVQRHITIIRKLKKEVAGVGVEITATTIIGAPHVGPLADALISPMIPHPVGVQAYGKNRRLGGFRPKID